MNAVVDNQLLQNLLLPDISLLPEHKIKQYFVCCSIWFLYSMLVSLARFYKNEVLPVRNRTYLSSCVSTYPRGCSSSLSEARTSSQPRCQKCFHHVTNPTPSHPNLWWETNFHTWKTGTTCMGICQFSPIIHLDSTFFFDVLGNYLYWLEKPLASITLASHPTNTNEE